MSVCVCVYSQLQHSDIGLPICKSLQYKARRIDHIDIYKVYVTWRVEGRKPKGNQTVERPYLRLDKLLHCIRIPSSKSCSSVTCLDE